MPSILNVNTGRPIPKPHAYFGRPIHYYVNEEPEQVRNQLAVMHFQSCFTFKNMYRSIRCVIATILTKLWYNVVYSKEKNELPNSRLFKNVRVCVRMYGACMCACVAPYRFMFNI